MRRCRGAYSRSSTVNPCMACRSILQTRTLSLVSCYRANIRFPQSMQAQLFRRVPIYIVVLVPTTGRPALARRVRRCLTQGATGVLAHGNTAPHCPGLCSSHPSRFSSSYVEMGSRQVWSGTGGHGAGASDDWARRLCRKCSSCDAGPYCH